MFVSMIMILCPIYKLGALTGHHAAEARDLIDPAVAFTSFWLITMGFSVCVVHKQTN